MIDEESLWTLAEQTPGISALALLVYWFLRHLREERELRDARAQREEDRRERIENRRIETLDRISEECRHAHRETTAVIAEASRTIALCTSALEAIERRSGQDRDRTAA